MVGRIVIVKWLSEVRRNSAPLPYFSTRITPPVLLTMNPAVDRASINLDGNLSFTFHIDFKNRGGAKGCKGKSHLGSDSLGRETCPLQNHRVLTAAGFVAAAALWAGICLIAISLCPPHFSVFSVLNPESATEGTEKCGEP